MIIMIDKDGMAPYNQNPMYGPPAATLVRYGAKETALIKYHGQWWRLISPIMLHAGIIHLVSNVFIQFRVGGYLNQIFGWFNWLVIYLISGVFGNIVSCIFIPSSVGVGSSGAVLGMLTAWIVWIVFRWKKIPTECRSQRNCQLVIVTISVVVTLALSFAPFVDWGAHFGGALMGLLSAFVMLSSELDKKNTRYAVRVIGFIGIFVLYTVSLYWLVHIVRPSTINLPYWAANDDFDNHGWK